MGRIKLKRYLTNKLVSHAQVYGTTFAIHGFQPSALAIRRKSPWRCWSESSKLAASGRRGARPVLRLRHNDDAAEKIGRDWIGINITQLAITSSRSGCLTPTAYNLQFVSASTPEQMVSRVAESGATVVRVIGEPVSPADAASWPKMISINSNGGRSA